MYPYYAKCHKGFVAENFCQSLCGANMNMSLQGFDTFCC